MPNKNLTESWKENGACPNCGKTTEHGACSKTKPLECGNLITCKDASVRDGETLRDHLVKNHPQLFTKEHQDMFQCRAAPQADIKLEVLLEPLRKIVDTYQTMEEEQEKMLKGFSYTGPSPRKDYFTPITDLFDELANAYQQLDDDYWSNVEKHELDRTP